MLIQLLSEESGMLSETDLTQSSSGAKDSVVELWKAEAQDAKQLWKAETQDMVDSLGKAGSNFILGEEARTSHPSGGGSEVGQDAGPASVLFTCSEVHAESAELRPLKRKKGPAPKMLGNEVCSVCGDKASGFHYNVLSCEGCKGFFRRSVIKGARYTCHSGGQCPMDTYMRRKCQECRLRKCRQAGMREQCVLSEEQIRLKKLKRQEEEQGQASALTPRAPSPPLALPQLSPEQRGMIEKLVAAQQQCNQRSFSDRLRVTPWPLAPDPQSREARQQRFAHFTELAIVSVQEIVDFAKQLPGFLQLSREDQIALLKTSTIEVMLLETSRRYNPGSESITFLKDFSYNRDDFAKAGLQVEFINPIFEFSRAMNELQLNDAEFALLIAISIFSADRPNVQDQLQVERLQHTYVEALHAYVSIHHPNDPLMFPRMLMKLVSLRTLSSVHSEQVFALRLQDKKLPPLLSEIWDVQE
ncbi:oxysterols receptor LXR-alpha isoform X1 [Trichosurus vulpecula]|uniref:oxysterols receptor LXR-alpha isoform X1 n=1 Tax=Trichosurus vulpecula TaxID=9337 RepID=UPI00186ADA48|nr:oxysterols receptor LXR-alpha isoform X1 [Trichosurus vulpecula]XP_036620036.1 oxysterols receptor LXR-alpha isoform X1 [Trichosurus vulpecula]